MVRVLFVCTGNICRSPTAEGVFRRHVREAGLEECIVTDSAGTHSYHTGDPPDLRSQRAAKKRGVDLSDLRARTVARADFDRFDYVLAMDRNHLHQLERMKPKGSVAQVGLFLDYAHGLEGHEVPDPYYGGPEDFEEVLDLVEIGSRGLLERILAEKL